MLQLALCTAASGAVDPGTNTSPVTKPHRRARVMLVAAKCLAQENRLEAAIDCTREIRALAARHSSLPGGSSGVASAVTHEAFKLEVKTKSSSLGHWATNRHRRQLEV